MPLGKKFHKPKCFKDLKDPVVLNILERIAKNNLKDIGVVKVR